MKHVMKVWVASRNFQFPLLFPTKGHMEMLSMPRVSICLVNTMSSKCTPRFLEVPTDAHGILLYMENNYFYFSMHSSSLYHIHELAMRVPRLHKYYTSSVWCHTASWLEPVSLTLRTSLRLRQIKLNDSSSLCKDISVYVKPVIVTRLDTVRCSRRNSRSLTREDEAEILTPRKVVFKRYALHSKRIPYIWVSEDVICLASHQDALSLSVQSFAWTPQVLRAWIYTFSHSTNHSAVHLPTYETR